MMKCRSITGIDTTSEPAPGPQLPVGPFLPTENRKSTVSIENLGMEDRLKDVFRFWIVC